MDKQEIDDAFEGHSDCELTDFSVSGSEYLPSGADSEDSNADVNDEELDANEVSHALNIEENVIVTSDDVSLQNAVLYFSQNISLDDELGVNIYENNTRSELEEPYQQNNETAMAMCPKLMMGQMVKLKQVPVMMTM
ncbi:hypothetical protein J6590_071947, partial [Homalodisca vitripennis]